MTTAQDDGAATSVASGQRPAQTIFILGSLTALGPLTVDTYLPALPAVGSDFGASDAAVQLTLTGMLLGLAVGQLIVGPLSDSLGRRRPLVAGLCAHVVSSVLCAFAPSIEILSALRVVQGLACASVAVIVMAMVRDMFDDQSMARVMSRLMLVMGLAPILAPTLGSALVSLAPWPLIFVFLAALSSLMLVITLCRLPETLPEGLRRDTSVRRTVTAYRVLARDRIFVGVAVSGGLMTAGMFAYIAGASFVLQEGFGLSTGAFGLVFGAVALCLVATSQLNPFLVARFSPLRVLTGALVVEIAATTALLIIGLTGWSGVVGVVVCLVFAVSAAALAFPNTPAVALVRQRDAAGTAAAVLGFLQFGFGGLVAPLVGISDSTSAAPMGAVMLGTALIAGAILVFFVRPAVRAELKPL